MSSFHDEARRAADRVRALPKGARVRIVAHYDPDGVSSAAVLAGALRRLGANFHITYTYEHEEAYYRKLADDTYEANLFCDVGAAVAHVIAKLPGLNVILDHHQAPTPPASPNLVVVNAHALGLNGTTDACGATVSLAFAIALDEANWAYAAHALVGVWGDRQGQNGLQGWNAEVLEEALRQNRVVGRRQLRVEDAPLGALIAHPEPPWDAALKDVGDADAFLARHGLPSHATVSELGPHDQETLSSVLVARLLESGFPAYRVKELFRSTPESTTHGLPIPRMMNLLSAATREQEAGLGLAFLLGDKAARQELEALEARFHEKIGAALKGLAARVRRMRSIQVFEVTEPAYTGEVCGIAMAKVLPRTHATVAYSLVGDVARVSTRGTRELLEKGLDLAVAVNQAAATVSGTGGGHSIAAGASVAKARFEEFLSALDGIVVAQMGKGA